ncbi:MAG TPA: ATP-binding protein [Polyangia bacterium]
MAAARGERAGRGGQRAADLGPLQACLDALPFAVLLVEDTHRVVLANRATCAQLGQPAEAIVGASCHNVMHGLGLPLAGCPLEETLKTGVAAEQELFDARGGRWLAAAIYPTPRTSAAGRPLFLHIVRDITAERRAAGEAARRSELQATLTDLLRLALTDISLQSLLERVLARILSVDWLSVESRAVLFITEGEPAELVMAAQVGLPPSLCEVCARVPLGQCLCGRAAASGAVEFASTIDERHVRSHPGMQPHGHYVVPLRSQGRVLGVMNVYLHEGHARREEEERFLGAVADVIAGIVERRRAEQQLVRLGSAVEQSAEGVLITDAGGTIRYVNPTFERLIGWPAEELLGTPMLSPRRGFDPQLRSGIFEAVRRDGVWHGRVANVSRDGRPFHLDMTVSPVSDAGDPTRRLTNYIALTRDRTQEVQLEAQLRQSQKMEAMGQLASGIAHDFNNLLFVIIGYTDMVKRGLRDDDPLHDNAARAEQAARRAARLTNQLLAFSRRGAARPEVLALNEVVLEVERMLARIIGEHIELETRLPDGLGAVEVDRGLLEQALVNLVVNARDAMPEGGHLTIETGAAAVGPGAPPELRERPAGDYVTLTVADTGCGMAPEVVERIFEPFFTTKDPGRGTGLGLSTVYGIVNQAGGFITVASRPGQGSAFRLFLPRARTATAVASRSATAGPRPPAPPAARETVLVVDDDEGVRTLVGRVLARKGYRVLDAPGGEEALAVAQAHEGEIHLVLADVVMGRMSGPQLAARLLVTRPASRVLFMSGHADELLARKEWAGAAGFLRKPLTPEELLGAVREALDQPATAG